MTGQPSGKGDQAPLPPPLAPALPGCAILRPLIVCVCVLRSWYFGKLKRVEAEKRLLHPCNDHGAFLIRDSESRRDDYSLSGDK